MTVHSIKIVTLARAVVIAVTIAVLLTAAVAPELQAMEDMGNQRGVSDDLLLITQGMNAANREQVIKALAAVGEEDIPVDAAIADEGADPKRAERAVVVTYALSLTPDMNGANRASVVESVVQVGWYLSRDKRLQAYQQFIELMNSPDGQAITAEKNGASKAKVIRVLAEVGYNLDTAEERAAERADVLTHALSLIPEGMDGANKAEVITAVAAVLHGLPTAERLKAYRQFIYAVNQGVQSLTGKARAALISRVAERMIREVRENEEGYLFSY